MQYAIDVAEELPTSFLDSMGKSNAWKMHVFDTKLVLSLIDVYFISFPDIVQ